MADDEKAVQVEEPEAVDEATEAVSEGGDDSVAPAFTEVTEPSPTDDDFGIDQHGRVQMLRDVSLKVRVELGRGKMLLKNLLRLTDGSVVELEKIAGDPLDIYVNDRIIARGEVLVLDERFCIRITEILTPEDCLRVKSG